MAIQSDSTLIEKWQFKLYSQYPTDSAIKLFVKLMQLNVGKYASIDQVKKDM
jgi:hypothetical protein